MYDSNIRGNTNHPGEKVEEQFSASTVERHESEFIDNEQVRSLLLRDTTFTGTTTTTTATAAGTTAVSTIVRQFLGLFVCQPFLGHFNR